MYLQCDGVAMDFLLGILLASILMISLEEDLIPTSNSFQMKTIFGDTHANVEPTKFRFI